MLVIAVVNDDDGDINGADFNNNKVVVDSTSGSKSDDNVDTDVASPNAGKEMNHWGKEINHTVTVNDKILCLTMYIIIILIIMVSRLSILTTRMLL